MKMMYLLFVITSLVLVCACVSQPAATALNNSLPGKESGHPGYYEFSPG